MNTVDPKVSFHRISFRSTLYGFQPLLICSTLHDLGMMMNFIEVSTVFSAAWGANCGHGTEIEYQIID